MDSSQLSPFDPAKGMEWLLKLFIKTHKKVPPEKYWEFFGPGYILPEGLPIAKADEFSIYMGSMTGRAWELFHKTEGYYIDEAAERLNRPEYKY